MRVRRYCFLTFACIATLAVLALASRGASAQQVVLGNARGLDFGRFVAGGGGTIILSPSGLRSRTGTVILLNSPNTAQAVFNVGKSNNGNGNKAVSISLPANGSTRLTSGANSMAVGNFVKTPSGLAAIPVGGTTLAIGATLTVAPNQPPGVYSGTFSLTVNYQ